MKYNRQFLDIAEYASIAGSALGTVVAVASGQVAYVAAPLTLAISLNVVNRRSSVANLDRTVQSLQQKVQVLPAQPLNLNSITQSLQQINQKTESLTQQFNARLEPNQIKELKETIAHLPHTQKVDLIPITESIEELKQSYKTLTQQFNARPETQDIANLTKQLNALKLRLDNFPKLVDLSEIEAKLGTLEAQLQAIDKSFINDSIVQLQSQIAQIRQQIKELPPPFDPSLLFERMQEQEESDRTITAKYNRLVQLVQAEMTRLRQSITEVQNSATTTVVEVSQRFLGEIESLRATIHALPTPTEPVDLNGIEAKIETLKLQIQAIDLSSVKTSIAQLQTEAQTQINQIYQQVQELPPPFDPSLLFERMQKQEESDRSPLAEYNYLTQLLHTEITRVQQLITSVQNSYETAVAEVSQHFSEEIKSLHATIHALPTPKELDLSGVEAKIETLNLQIQAIDLSSITSSIVQIQTEAQTQINQINHQINQLPSLLDLDAIKQQLSELDTRNRNLFNDYVKRLVPAVKGLRSDKALTQQAIVDISNQLKALELKLNNLLVPPEPVDLSEIEGAITNLNYQLGELTQQYNTRPEPTAIERLNEMIALAIQRLDNLPPLPEPVDLSGIEELKTEVEQLEQRLQIVSRLDLEIESLRQVLSQIDDIQQRLENLDVSNGDLHDYARRLKNEVEQRINQIHMATAELAERTQNFLPMSEQLKEIKLLTAELDQRTIALDERTCNLDQMEHQLKAVQHLTIELDEMTECLLNHTRNLDEMQQQLTRLQQLLIGYTTIGDLEVMLGEFRQEFSNQIDTSVEMQVAQLNQLLKEIQPAYQYELVIDRSGTRNVLMKALEEAQQRLIIVNPWLSKHSIDEKVLCKCRNILNQQGKIHIGWGHLSGLARLKPY